VFARSQDNLKVAPVICFESVFGEYLNDYILNGANLIFVITNDGWWGNSPGHRQHLTFSQIRAIETRRSIARSANTGISAFISQRGEIQQPTRYWEPAVIRQQINANTEITTYVRYGDYIARLSIFVTIGLILITFVRRIMKKGA
jgi:apolipoprotein N-acyltransferase